MNTAPSIPWLDRLLIALFAVALVIPAAFLKPDEQAAAAEKRTLAPAPKAPRNTNALAAFPDAFDAWFADHFGFRQALIKTHARISFFALKTSPSPKVILGRNGYIFLKGTPEADGDPIADFRGTVPLTPYELERWRWQLEDEHAWLRNRNIDFIFSVIPGKEHMNPEFMPVGFENIGSPGSYDQFISYVAPRATYPFVILRPVMQAAKDHAIIYRKTDTHWNDAGAWAGAFALSDTVRLTGYPSTPVFHSTDLIYSVTNYHEGDMGNMIGLPGETCEPLVTIRRKDSPVTVFPLSDHPLGDIVTMIGNTNLPKAVLFHDSFGHYLKPILGEFFQWLRFRWSNAGIDRNVVEDAQPDVVIHLMAERRIRMGQRYEMGVQQEGCRDRFDRLGQTAILWDQSTSFAGIQAPDGVTSETTADGLVLTGHTRPAGFMLPPVTAASTYLPVIRVECSTPANEELALSWDNGARTFTQMIKGPIPAGRHVVYLPVLDPETSGRLHLDVVRGSASLTLHAVEIRLIAR